MNLEDVFKEAFAATSDSAVGAAGIMDLASMTAIVTGLIGARVITPAQGGAMFRFAADTIGHGKEKGVIHPLLSQQADSLRTLAGLVEKAAPPK